MGVINVVGATPRLESASLQLDLYNFLYISIIIVDSNFGAHCLFVINLDCDFFYYFFGGPTFIFEKSFKTST